MARKTKDITVVQDGVKYTFCAPRMPRKAEKTFPVEKSRYSVWAQGVSNYCRGTRGVNGTVDQLFA